MALIVLITGRLKRECDLLSLERVAMGPYGHTSVAWEEVFHAPLVILTAEKFYDHLRKKQHVFV